MKIEHIKASDLLVNKWSGGTSTQLAIFPEGSNYAERNFLFRISTATVETEESIFTKLPGVSRKIMILEGEIRIEHQNHYSKILKKFEQDEFSGDWETKSFGKAVDFNLMTKGNTKGEIEAITIESSDTKLFKLNSEYIGIYVLKGKSDLKINDKIYNLYKNDFVSIFSINEIERIEISPKSTLELILTKINFQ